MGLIFTESENGWIVGKEKELPLVLKTTNRGLDWKDWKKVNFDQESRRKLDGKISYFLDICFDPAGHSWIVGSGGIVEAFLDGENLKVSSIFPTAEILASVSCDNAGEVWAVGQNAVFHYRNGWNKKEIDKKHFLVGVKSDGNDVWILGGDNSKPEADEAPGILLRSRNNGLTWENKTPESASVLYDLYLKDGKGWLIGAGGKIYYSTDNGNSWIGSKSPTKNDLVDIFFLDSKNGWISGDRATILKLQ